MVVRQDRDEICRLRQDRDEIFGGEFSLHKLMLSVAMRLAVSSFSFDVTTYTHVKKTKVRKYMLTDLDN